MPLLKATSMIGTLPGCAALSESERTGCTALSAGIAKAECMAARNTKGWELQAYLMSSCYRLVLNGQCIAMKAMAGQGGSWQAKAGHARLIKPADCLFAELAGGQLCG